MLFYSKRRATSSGNFAWEKFQFNPAHKEHRRYSIQHGFTLLELMCVIASMFTVALIADISSDALLSQTFFNSDGKFVTIDNAKVDTLAQSLQNNGTLEFDGGGGGLVPGGLPVKKGKATFDTALSLPADSSCVFAQPRMSFKFFPSNSAKTDATTGLLTHTNHLYFAKMRWMENSQPHEGWRILDVAETNPISLLSPEWKAIAMSCFNGASLFDDLQQDSNLATTFLDGDTFKRYPNLDALALHLSNLSTTSGGINVNGNVIGKVEYLPNLPSETSNCIVNDPAKAAEGYATLADSKMKFAVVGKDGKNLYSFVKLQWVENAVVKTAWRIVTPGGCGENGGGTPVLPSSTPAEWQALAVTCPWKGEANPELPKSIITGSISGTVWNDLNGNSQRDADEPVTGKDVWVSLTGTNVSYDKVFTDENGNYTFSNLLPGQYRLYIPTSLGATAGKKKTSYPSDFFNIVTLLVGQNVTNVNFGMVDIPSQPLFTLSTSKIGNGTISSNLTGINCGTDCTENYSSGSVVTLTATPATGSVFSGWSGACSGANPTTAVTMDAAKSCTANFASMQSKGTAVWTFMVYLDADNDLESYGISDFLEMAQIGSDSNVNIVVQFDRRDSYDYSNDDWTTCKRFLVKKSMNPTAANQISDIGECNMGDPATLTSFINWSVTQYPASKYALVIWNHGGGWKKTDQQAVYKEVASDDTNNDVLYMHEVKSALKNATQKVDFIGFDACLMAMVEVGYELKDVLRNSESVLVGSEKTEPGDGWPYHTILPNLVNNPSLTPTDLGKSIVDNYYSSYSNGQTQSVVAIKNISQLATTVSNLAQVMKTGYYSEVKNAAQAVMDGIKTTVIHEKHGDQWSGSHGLAIYFPKSGVNSLYNPSQILFAKDTQWDEFLASFVTSAFQSNPQTSWIKNARNLSQVYDDLEVVHTDLYDFSEKLVQQVTSVFLPCDSPTIKSTGNNTDWNSPNTWIVLDGGTSRKPLDTDKVLVQASHTVLVPNSEIKIDSLCNQGNILGQNGNNGYWASSTSYTHATASGGVWLKATNSVINKSTGKIKAGLAGNDITHDATHKERTLEAKGANSGSVTVTANVVVNESGGVIGPEKGISYSNGGLVTDGGNGGVGSNTYKVNHLGCDGTDPNLPNLGSGWNYGNAYGGKGGDTKVEGKLLLENKGTIASGYGGDARVWTCTYSATAGNFGDLTALSKNQLVLSGTVRGGKGKVLIEPEIMLSGSDMRIEDAKEIIIFGGDDWRLDLRNLSPGAITAEETIILAVGKGGVIDLRGVNAQVMKAGIAVKIYADTVLLDEGVTLQSLVEAPSIETQPSKILYAVTLSGTENLTGDAGNTATADLRITNAGPIADTYTLSVSDEAGWELSGLPSTVTVDGLQTAELTLNVALPANPSVPKDVIKVKATSQADPSVETEMVITVLVNGMEQSVEVEDVGEYTTHGTLLDKQGNPIAGATITIDDQTTTTDELGNWEISGLVEGEYTLIATKESYVFAPQVIALGNDAYHQKVTIKPLSSLALSVIPNTWQAVRQGEDLTYTMTITNGGNETATNVTLTNQLPTGATLVSLESIEAQCDTETLICTLPALTSGATATVKLTLHNDLTDTLKTVSTLTSTEYPVDVKTSFKSVKPHLSVTLTDTPDPVVMESALHYQAAVELSPLAPIDTATGIHLTLQLPAGTEFKNVTTEYGTCDSSQYPVITCQLNDLSIATPDSISRAVVDIDVQLIDASLLILTHEAKVSATNYPEHITRERTNIVVPDTAVADIVLVLDTTESMNEELNGVIAAIEKFIQEQMNKTIMPTVALVEFKDNVTLRAFTNDMNALLATVRSLAVEGGGLCPEASAEALHLAISHTKEGGIVVFSTDASPYEDADMAALAQRIKEKGIVLNAIVSGDCGDGDSHWNDPAKSSN